MKYALLPMIALFFVSISSAQSVYESPHVKDGTTVQLTIPHGYERDEDIGTDQNALFISTNDVLESGFDLASIPMGMITIAHFSDQDLTLESFKQRLEEQIEIEEKKLEMIEEPTIMKVNGRNCLFAGIKGNAVGESIGRTYFSVSKFGDYFILINYFSTEQFEEYLEYGDFKTIMSSWSEIPTDKDDGIDLADLDTFFEDELPVSENDSIEEK